MVRKWAATCKWMTLELKMDQRPKCKFKTYKILRRINGSKFSWLWVCQRVYKYGTKTWWHQSTSYKRKKEKLNFYWCIYNVVLGSGVQYSDSATCVHGSILFQILNPNPYQSVSQFSRSVVSDSLWPHESQHARPPCPSPSPRVHSDSHPSSPWCHPAISSWVVPLLLLPPIPPSIRVFSNESTLHIRWRKYWSFSFSIIPSKEHPGLISFRMDWLDLLAVQESSPTPQLTQNTEYSSLCYTFGPCWFSVLYIALYIC